MRFLYQVGAIVIAAGLPWVAAAQSNPAQTAPQTPPAGLEEGMKVGVIDIDRIAAESEPGKVLLEKLKQESDKINAERAKREKDISDMQTKMASELVSAQARDQMTRDLQRARTDMQRWLEDSQRAFQEKQMEAENQFQDRLRPIVGEIAKQGGFGLILRADPSLTMVLNPNLDITLKVIEAFNAEQAPPAGK